MRDEVLPVGYTHPIYRTARWRRVRKMVLQRDGYRCMAQLPGCTGTADAVDHIISLEDGGDRNPYSPMALRAICTHCNSARVHIVKLGQLGVSPSRRW